MEQNQHPLGVLSVLFGGLSAIISYTSISYLVGIISGLFAIGSCTFAMVYYYKQIVKLNKDAEANK
jgi:predicted lysophospholipase L1 biosynthesis ABC-type transport system permease subunit